MKRILAVDDEPDLPEIATAEVCRREGAFRVRPKPFDLNDMNHTAA